MVADGGMRRSRCSDDGRREKKGQRSRNKSRSNVCMYVDKRQRKGYRIKSFSVYGTINAGYPETV
jgi:hypothetical protein